MSPTLDWLGTLVPGDVFMLLYGTECAIFLAWGVHAMIVARREGTPVHRNFPFWLGLTLIVSCAVTTGFFAFAFFVGAARLTGLGLVIFGPGLLAVIVAAILWPGWKGGRRDGG